MLDTIDILRRHTSGDSGLLDLLLGHSRAVRDLALRIAAERNLKVDRRFVAEAAMLHDIGIGECDAPSIRCHGAAPYICHGLEGARILEAEGLPEHARVAARHTGSGLTATEISERGLPLPAEDFLPETLEEKLICYADKFYSKSRGFNVPKPLEKIRSQMAVHGAGPAARFRELEELFGNPFEEFIP